MTNGLTRKDTNFIGLMFVIVILFLGVLAVAADSRFRDICAAVECGPTGDKR